MDKKHCRKRKTAGHSGLFKLALRGLIDCTISVACLILDPSKICGLNFNLYARYLTYKFCHYHLKHKPLPNYKILDMTKLKTFADNKLHVDKMTTSFSDRVELGEKEKMLVTRELLFPHCFRRPSSLGLLKVRIVW